MNAWLSKAARDRAAKAAKIERLRSQAANALCQLRELAKTDLNALDELSTELLFHVRGMNCDALQNLEFSRRLTRRCPTWPGVASADKWIKASNNQLVKEFQLGAEAMENYSGRQWSRRTPEIRAALTIRSCLINHKVKLPRLTRKPDTAIKWWRAGRKFFEQIYGKDFEHHPNFKSYWRRIPAATGREDSRSSQASWIRKEILSKMPQAFRSLAPKS
jgi:hypothetical protein